MPADLIGQCPFGCRSYILVHFSGPSALNQIIIVTARERWQFHAGHGAQAAHITAKLSRCTKFPLLICVPASVAYGMAAEPCRRAVARYRARSSTPLAGSH